jgi:hypothetical protein
MPQGWKNLGLCQQRIDLDVSPAMKIDYVLSLHQTSWTALFALGSLLVIG